jgi:hypothetical protein
VGIVSSTVKVQQLGFRIVECYGVFLGPGESYLGGCLQGPGIFLSRAAVGDERYVINVARRSNGGVGGG